MDKQIKSPENNQIVVDQKTFFVVLLLFFFYPIGLILMWAWMKKWPVWIKLIISFPVLIMLLWIPFVIFLIFLNPKGLYEMSQAKTSPTPEPIACTMEAKLCPDGSAVGRNPKNHCEFDPCPTERPNATQSAQ